MAGRLSRADLVVHALALPGAVEDYPWGEDEQVAKVGGKVFAFFGLGGGTASVALKAPPDLVEELRCTYPTDVTTAPYLSKRHWSLVRVGASVPDDEVLELVRTSYDAVVAGLPRRLRPGGWRSNPGTLR